MPRMLGYVFNPLSVYFCHDANSELKAIVYEVHNTFHERHSYVMPVAGAGDRIDQRCEKAFYVSPFLGMDLRYEFSACAPGERINIAIRGYDSSGPVIATALSGEKKTLSDGTLLAALFAFPFLTLKVMAGAIHWHALRLYLKGLKVYAHTAAPVAAGDLSGRKRP